MATFGKTSVLAVAVLGVAAVATHGATGAGDAGRGKVLFRKQCATCHGADGHGRGSAAVAMTKPPADLTDPAFWGSRSDEHIAQTMRQGHGHMPPLHRSDRDVAYLVAYLRQAFVPASR